LLICTLSHAAGINTDGSLGPATTLTGPNYTIPPELGQQKGSNLFHSFGYFSVRNGEKATFITDPRYTTNNIIGRVTGGEKSEIYGSLICKTAGANLWLLNPAGILFGAGASLDVQGSFHASTADSLQLSDGGVFYTDLSKTSKLTTAAPSAFGFLSSKPEGITIDGSSLSVKSGKTLSLIGGDINNVNGQLIAPSGKINLVSLASPGEVVLNEDGIAVTGSPELGDIRISSKTDAAATASQPKLGTDESKDEMILEQSGSLRNKLAGQASSSLIDVSGSKKDATSSGSVDIHCKKFSYDNSWINSDN
jgi:filamentous hemagglutinin family protein